MISYKNDWFSWSFDDVRYSFKKKPTSSFSTSITPYEFTATNHLDELMNNAVYVRDHFSEPLDLFFSGGVNSQVILRVYHQLGIPINVFIVRFEDSFNVHDVVTAKQVCESLNVPYTLIDFNLRHFFENEADDYYKKCFCLDLKHLIQLKISEFSDNIPIIGNRYPYIIRDSMFYSQPGTWMIKMIEDELIMPSYLSTTRPAVTDWFFYSPEVVVSLLNTPVVQNIVHDRIDGRATFLFEKNDLYKSCWPDFAERTKRPGLYIKSISDDPMHPEASMMYPEFITDFYSKKIDGVVRHTPPIGFNVSDFIGLGTVLAL